MESDSEDNGDGELEVEDAGGVGVGGVDHTSVQNVYVVDKGSAIPMSVESAVGVGMGDGVVQGQGVEVVVSAESVVPPVGEGDAVVGGGGEMDVEGSPPPPPDTTCVEEQLSHAPVGA